MKTFSVRFLPHDKTIEVPENQRLIRAAMDAGVHVNASCGGEGVCGKCRVIVEQGEVRGGITEKLRPEDVAKGVRQACLAEVTGDLVVRIPVESEVDASVLNQAAIPRKTARIREMNLADLKEKGLFTPPVEKICLSLPEPTAQDNLPDLSRLIGFLKLNHDEHRLEADLSVIRKIPEALRGEDFSVTATIARPVREEGKNRIINVQAGNRCNRNFAIAVDVGTTTVYGQVLDLYTGDVLAQYGTFNGQISYGEDVISRIIYAGKPEGAKRLHEAVTGSINTIIEKLMKKSRVDPQDVSSITLAGNTTMTQLLLQVNPKYIRLSPYVPASTLYPPVRAVDIGLDLADHVTALVYPAISSYVGGDIVAGVMGSGMYRTDALTLFMDIGTNAEIVIGNREWMACAACSAGPAFEGGGITFGMRAAKGAIEDFSLNLETLEPMNITIGNVRAKGICGSGLITVVATLLEAGVIDGRGRFDRTRDTPRIRETDGIWEYVLAWADETQISRDITITEPDIDNLIRAKGAVYSGCETLLNEVGMSFDDVERIILAGGFGSYVDLEKAMVIGLLPEVDPDKVIFVGNGSLMGAKMSSLTNRIRKDVVEVTRKMTNFELSETPSYMDHYMAALFLPHTDINRFGRLKSRLDLRKTIMSQRS